MLLFDPPYDRGSQPLQIPDAGRTDIFALVSGNSLRVVAKNARRSVLLQNDGSAVHIDFQGVLFPDI